MLCITSACAIGVAETVQSYWTNYFAVFVAFLGCFIWLFPLRNGRFPLEVALIAIVVVIATFPVSMFFLKISFTELFFLSAQPIWMRLALILGGGYFGGAISVYLVGKIVNKHDSNHLRKEEEREYLRQFDSESSKVFQSFIKSELNILRLLMLFFLLAYAAAHWNIFQF